MKNRKNEKITCCICGEKFNMQYSHNPYPVREESWFGERENRCCGECNDMFVIKSRIAMPRKDVIARNVFIAKLRKMDYEALSKVFN